MVACDIANCAITESYDRQTRVFSRRQTPENGSATNMEIECFANDIVTLEGLPRFINMYDTGFSAHSWLVFLRYSLVAL